MQLLTDDARVDAPTDIHFVTSGYAPLSVRIVQAAVTTGTLFTQKLCAARLHRTRTSSLAPLVCLHFTELIHVPPPP